MYRIAGLNVAINGEGALLNQRAEAYRIVSTDPIDIKIDISEEYMQELHHSFPYLSLDECAYINAGDKFHYGLLNFNCFRLHASAVVVDGKAYLFSAPSGTGKSTHTSLWCDYFGNSRSYILNDDSPTIKRTTDQFIAYGTPWSGTSPLNRNVGVPLQAIAFIEQSKVDWIRPATHSESIIKLMSQTLRTNNQERSDKLLTLLAALIEIVPIYCMGCTIGFSSVEKAYATMSS